jgi:3-hydroxyacyl-[acyl-carrier-protein] dehydratase
MNVNTLDIKLFLPHREPMLMVNNILKLSQEHVETEFFIKEDNIFVNQNNFFEEIGLLENAAQTCSSIVGQSFFIDENNEVKTDVKLIGFISTIKKATVYRLPKTKQIIHTKAKLVSRFDNPEYSICTIVCETYLENEIILDAEINLFIQESN